MVFTLDLMVCFPTRQFCDETCIDAVAALVRAWGVDWDLECTDINPDFEEERRAHRKLLLRMYEVRTRESQD